MKKEIEIIGDYWEQLGLSKNLKSVLELYFLFESQKETEKNIDEIVQLILDGNEKEIEFFENLSLSKQKEIFTKIAENSHQLSEKEKIQVEHLFKIIPTSHILDFFSICQQLYKKSMHHESFFAKFHQLRVNDILFMCRTLWPNYNQL